MAEDEEWTLLTRGEPNLSETQDPKLLALETGFQAQLQKCGVSSSALGNYTRALVEIASVLDNRISVLACNALGNDEEMARKMQEEIEKEERQRKEEEEQREQQLFEQFLMTCQLCQKVNNGQDAAGSGTQPLELRNCEHRVCPNCVRAFWSSKELRRQADYTCPLPGCEFGLAEVDVKALLPEQEYERFVDLALQDMDTGNMVKCPMNCGWALELDASSPQTKPPPSSETGIDGKQLTPEAIQHRERYRFRCRRCPDTEFCAKCLTTPYHVGFTCEGYKRYLASRKCRFCGSAVKGDGPTFVKPEDANKKKALRAALAHRFVEVDASKGIEVLREAVRRTDILGNLCESSECRGRASNACQVIRPCGHLCLGVKGEKNCVGCMDERCSGASGQSSTDLCNICWVEELGHAPCVRLECGHVFHHHCIKSKIEARWAGARITFSFIECPLCKKHMKAEVIKDLVNPYIELYATVRAKAEQRLALEGGHTKASELQPSGRYHKQPVDYAMHKFAYYMCFKCKNPYFGGHRSCEVAAGEGEAGREFDASEMICGGCSAMGATSCPTHGSEAIEYKCKFCCSVASWFCWGTTHFCDSCHRKQGTPESMSRKQRKDLPQCTPKTCPLRVPHPPNGEEFVLGCQICRSASFC